MGEFSDRIPQHRHCVGCGKAYTGDGNFCSDACKETGGREAKRKLRKLMLVWIGLVVVTAVVLFFVAP